MKLSEIKIDSNKQEEGGWVDNIPELAGLRFKTRGSMNKDWRRMQNRMVQAVPRAEKIDGLSPQHSDRINGILLRETAILDWDGIEGEDGEKLPFSKEMFQKIWDDPDMQKFREGALWAANVVAERRKGEVDEDAKN